MESSIDWLDPEGFGLTACVDETSQPMRWRVVAHDLLHSRPGPELPDPAQCESSTTTSTVLFPPFQTVLAAGVVQNRGPRAATAPRSVVVTASTKFPHGIDPCDTHQPLKIRDDNRCNDGQQHCEGIHIWSLRIRRRLPGCAPTPAVPKSDTNPAPGKPNQAHYTSDRVYGETGADSGSKPPGLTIILHEMTSMPILQGASPAGILCRSDGAGIRVRQQQQQEQQQGGRWNGTMGSTAAAGGGSWRCSLAHTGAWAALQVSSTRVLLINFEAVLEPTTIPCPHFPDPAPGVQGTTSLSAVAAAAAGPGSSAIETTHHQMQPPHQNGTTSLRCLDLDLAAVVAATFGESSSLHLCQALSCYGYADQVVLDVALAADAGRRRANSEHDGSDPSSGADGNVEGHSVLLRISFPVEPVPNNCRSGSEDEPMDGVAKGGGGVAALVGSKWGGAAVTASVQLRGQISTCCQLHCLSEPGSRRTRSGKTSPTMSGGTSAGAVLQAPIDPPALVGVSARGHLYLITPYSPTAVTGAEMEAGERYLDKGALKGPQSSGLGPGGAGAAALSEQCQPPSPLALAVVAQLLLPGPVISIHPLPRICTSAIFGISGAGAGGDPSGDGGCSIDGAQGCQGHPGHQAGSQQMARTATKAVFAAVLCSDTARSIAVLRIIRWLHSEDAQLAVRRPDATAAAGCRATGAATAGVPRSAVRADDPFRRWSLQQLLVVPGVQAILPVPLPSALSLALAPARSGCGRDKNDAGAEAVRADGFGSLGGDAVRDRGVAVLVSPAAILILGRPNGAEGKGPAGRVGAGRTGHGLGDVVRRRGGDVWMQDVEEDEKMADEEEAREPEHIEDSDDEWGGVYTQRQCLHPQHGRQWQQQPQDYGRTHQDEEAEEERGGGGGLTALGPVGLGPWRRALILPAEVQPLPPQALLVPGSATTSAAALPSAAAAAPFFAAGAVTGLLLIDPSCDMPQVDARQMQRGRPEQEQKHGHPGGLGSGDDDGRSGVQEAGMAKVLAHMSRQWDAGVQRILEQRATLARMVHLTREAEQLMADAGQQPLPACGSAAARPPSRAALLDPLLDLEKEFLIQPQQRVRSRSAVSTRESAGPPAAGAGRGGGGDGDGDGDGTDMSAAVDKLLDQLLGCGGAGAANGGNVAATVPAAVAARSRSESAPTTIHVPTVAAAGAKAGGGEGGAAASEPQVPDNGSSWSPVLESLTQTRQAGNWVLRAVLRLESGQEAGGGGRFAAVANADGNGRGSGSDNGRSAGDKRPPVASGQQRPPLTPPPPPLQLDDVVLLPYCHSGLGLRSVLGRWEVLDRGSRRVAVEAAVPLGELLALASAAAATATPGGCLDAGSGAEWELDSESRHLRDLQIALGPLPGLFEGPNDDGDDTVYSDGCSSDTDTDIEAACNLDDGGLHDHDENGGIGTRPTHGNSSITSRSTACKARELHLGATVRITARVSSCPYLEDSGGRIGGSTESSSASLLQVRVLDVGRVIVPLHSLLQSGTNGNLAQRQQQQVEGGSKGASKAGVGDIHGGIGSVRQPPLRPATGLLLAPSRSLLLTATTGEAAGPEARMRTGAAPAAAAGGGGGVPSCGSVPCGIGAPQWARSGGMCGDLLERLLLEPGFRTPTEHESTGVRKSETAEDDEDRPTCGQLLWEGSMGWRCVVSLQPCGVYGCEVELSYVDGGGSGWDSWSSAALDHVQQLVTNAAGRSCEQVGRRLSLLCPNPLADSQLERMDIAAGALQRCVDATLELLEGALLAQQQQQLQQQQPRKQQQQNAARREVGTKPGFKDCTSGGVGTEAAMSAGATGARLQAMLQDVLQLQLQLHTAMETYLVT